MDKNLSEALLMAGTIVLGLLLMTAFINMMRAGGSVNKAYDETQIQYQINGFNYQFEIYQKDDNTILDMVNLLNLAYSVNNDNGYDINNCVTIEVNIGYKTFRIPRVTRDEVSDSIAFYDGNRMLQRNMVYDTSGGGSHGLMSIYDLLDKTINDLNIGTFTGTDKLTKIHLGEHVYYPDLPASDPNAGRPIKGTNGTTYKYVFECNNSELEYNTNTGRIQKMVFTCRVNPDWKMGSFPDGPTEQWD